MIYHLIASLNKYLSCDFPNRISASNQISLTLLPAPDWVLNLVSNNLHIFHKLCSLSIPLLPQNLHFLLPPFILFRQYLRIFSLTVVFRRIRFCIFQLLFHRLWSKRFYKFHKRLSKSH